jgi:hypothetical protein
MLLNGYQQGHVLTIEQSPVILNWDRLRRLCHCLSTLCASHLTSRLMAIRLGETLKSVKMARLLHDRQEGRTRLASVFMVSVTVIVTENHYGRIFL